MRRRQQIPVRMIQTALRIPEEAYSRAEALVRKLAADPTVSATTTVTRSTVLKLALMRGLELLEREYK